jgi:hypothetical protein
MLASTVRLPAVLLAALVVCALTVPASAMALTRAQQLDKAAGQASFQCFVHNCSRRRLLGALATSNGGMAYRFRYYGMHNVHAHAFYAHCDQLITVSRTGAVGQFRFYACA